LTRPEKKLYSNKRQEYTHSTSKYAHNMSKYVKFDRKKILITTASWSRKSRALTVTESTNRCVTTITT